jgi:hypothetical protein
MSPRVPDALSAAQSEEVDRQAPWERTDALRPLTVRLVGKAKRWTRTITVATGLMTATGAAIGAAKGYAVKLVKFWRVATRPQIGAAELPVTGQPTVGTDFVKKPKPPGE